VPHLPPWLSTVSTHPGQRLNDIQYWPTIPLCCRQVIWFSSSTTATAHDDCSGGERLAETAIGDGKRVLEVVELW